MAHNHEVAGSIPAVATNPMYRRLAEAIFFRDHRHLIVPDLYTKAERDSCQAALLRHRFEQVSNA